MRKIFNLLLAITFIATMAFPCWGENINDLKTELQKNKKTINTKTKQLNVVKEQKREISREIEILDRKIDTAREEIDKLKNQITSFNQNIEEKEKQIKNAEEKMRSLDQLMKSRIVALYKNGESTYIEIILDANNFTDFFARYQFVRSVIEQDKELLESTAETKALIEEAKVTLEKQKADRERAQKSNLSAKRSLDTYRGNRNLYLRNLSSRQKDIEAAIDEELKESERISEKIKRIQKGSKKVYSGNGFVWPISGSSTITSYFGYRVHPILKKKKMHTGIDIGAKSGTDIVASSSGTVIMADWLGGYGKAIIIDHGSGKSTLYAHASKLLVSEGEEVKTGDHIAEVGSTGLSTGPHLHFEVRENGTTVNPLKFVSK